MPPFESHPARPARRVPRLAALLLVLAPWGGACATYPERIAAAMADFERGNLPAAQRAFADARTTGSAFLGPAEEGTVALAAGDWSGARSAFDRAVEAVRAYEDRALVSAQDMGEDLLSWTVNEGSRSYRGEGFERVLLHAALAMTYLAEGKLQDVWVEVKRSNRLLESEEELYSKRYAAGGLAHYLSALAYELFDEPADAYIDYRRMLEKDAGTEVAGPALVRLARALGRDDEVADWLARFGEPASLPEGAASVVVIAGVGLAPFKIEHTLSIPLAEGIVQWSVPSFQRRPQQVNFLELAEQASGVRVRTSVLEDVARVAHENLEDRIAWLAAKSAVRATLKYQLTRKLEKDHGLGGLLVGSLFTILTERADLRSWQTLPDTWQAARLYVPPGEHTFDLTALGGASQCLGRFDLLPGETLVVLARTVGGNLFAHAIGGQRLDAAPTGVSVGDSAEPDPNEPRP